MNINSTMVPASFFVRDSHSLKMQVQDSSTHSEWQKIYLSFFYKFSFLPSSKAILSRCPSNAEPTHRAGEDALRTLVSSNFSAFTYLCRCDLKDLSKTSLWCLNVRWYQPYEFIWDSGWEKIHKNFYNIFKCLACRALKVQSPSESLRSKSVISPEQTSLESATLGSGSLHDKCR